MHLQRLKAGDMIPSQRIVKNSPFKTIDHGALNGGGNGNDRTVVESHEQRMNFDFWTHSYIVGTCDGLVGRSSEEWQMAIFSLKSGSWRNIRSQQESLPADYRRGVFRSGALHWGVIDWSRNNGTLIMSFDLSEEKFCQILLVP
ncbi:hypothetical protein NL676_021120 [Syzygium grande]|nr:hypothetical protein NL676_021120 [Syzygium grande]